MQKCFVKKTLNVKTIRMYHYDDNLIVIIWLNVIFFKQIDFYVAIV